MSIPTTNKNSSTINTKITRAISDSGSTHIIVKDSEKNILKNITQCTPYTSLLVELPNGAVIRSTATGLLLTLVGIDIPAYIFPDAELKQTLLSLSALTNRGCTVELTNVDITVRYQDKVILHGSKQPTARLWTIDICPADIVPNKDLWQLDEKAANKNTGSAHLAVHLDTDAEFVAFIHATFGSPTTSSFLKAINNGNLSEVPRLTANMTTRNLPNAVATAKGHLNQTRQGQRSTKASIVPNQVKAATGNVRSSTLAKDTSHLIEDNDSDNDDADDDNVADSLYVKVVDVSDTETIHSDITGRMAYVSWKGNKYVLVSRYKGYIHLEAMKDRSSEQLTLAYQRTIKFFRDLGHTITYQRLDNEISTQLTQLFADLVPPITMQLVPPNSHRANKAERAIQVGKNHIIAMLCAVDPNFPIKLWDECLPQAEITLNHLLQYIPNREVSAWEGIHHGKYDFKAHPLAPFGIKVVILDTPANRTSWGSHGLDGFYLAPALKHYRCWTVWCTLTEALRVTDSVAWFPAPLKMPGSSPAEMMTAAIKDLSAAMRAMSQPLSSEQQYTAAAHSTTITASLTELVQMYSHHATPPASIVPHTTPAPVNPMRSDQRVSAAADLLTPPGFLPLPIHQAVYPPDNTRRHMTRQQQSTQTKLDVARIDEATRQHDLLAGHALTASASSHSGLQQRVSTQRHRRYQQRPIKTSSKVPRISPSTTADFDSVDRTNALMKTLDSDCVTDAQKYAQANAALNLTEDGQPLKYKSAISTQPAQRSQGRHCILHPQIKEKMGADGVKTYRIRGTFGGDRLRGKYPFEVAARTAELEVVRLLLNSTISTEQARFMTIDIKDYYLGTPMDRSEWMWVDCKFIPETIMIEHELHQFVVNGRILFEVVKGMYGLPQAGILAQKQLIKRLAIDGYVQHDIVPCLFTHITNGTTFTLVVDDFGIKYTNIAAAEHLVSTLQKYYEIKVNMAGNKYLGMNLDFDYALGQVAISIPGYIEKVIMQFRAALNEALAQYKLKSTTQAASPSIYVPPKYGKRGPQLTTQDDSTIVDEKAIKVVEGIAGSMLYYSRVTDPTFITAVNDIASDQATPTTRVLLKADRLLAYAASYPNNQLIYKKSDMNLQQTSDCSYLSRDGSRSTGGGHGHMGMNDPDSTFVNGSIYEMSKVIDVVVASVAEGEYASVFMNAKKGAWIRVVCEALGHPQTTTRIRCDNECAVGIANDTVKIKRSKSFDMRWHWIRDRI